MHFLISNTKIRENPTGQNLGQLFVALVFKICSMNYFNSFFHEKMLSTWATDSPVRRKLFR